MRVTQSFRGDAGLSWMLVSVACAFGLCHRVSIMPGMVRPAGWMVAWRYGVVKRRAVRIT